MVQFTRRRRRMVFLSMGFVAAAVAVTLVLSALGDRVLYFYSPSEAKARNVETGRTINLGGLVRPGSFVRDTGTEVHFEITDNTAASPVIFGGALPDLFREGQGVIATGAFRDDGVFVAATVLAKHDENYMPPEVADALKKRGQWRAK